jgi:hypothetical protein
MTDDRQFQIRERAGLEDAKLNLEFIEFLRKWSTPLLIAVAVIAGGYALYTRYAKAQKEEISVAFEELHAASEGERPNPVSLIAVAEQYPKIKSVAVLARLGAGDAYLRAVRQRAALGAAINAADGTLIEASGLLTDTQREEYLNNAKQQYQIVFDATKNVPEKHLLAVAAAFGIAAVAESSGNFSDASNAYEEAARLAEAAGDALHVEIAKKRIASLDNVKNIASLPSQADLPKPPAPPAPPTTLPAPIGPAPTPEATPAPAATPAAAPGTTPAPNTPAPSEPAPSTPPAPTTPPDAPK